MTRLALVIIAMAVFWVGVEMYQRTDETDVAAGGWSGLLWGAAGALFFISVII